MSPLADKGQKITIQLMTPCWGCITCYCDGLVEINAINRNDMKILIYGSWFSNWQITFQLDLLTYLMNSENKVASDWIFQRQLGVFSRHSDVRKLTPWRLFLQRKHCVWVARKWRNGVVLKSVFLLLSSYFYDISSMTLVLH